MVGHRNGNAQLHFHAPGEILEGLVVRDGHFLQQSVIFGCIPVAEGALHNLSHLPGGEALGKPHLIQHNAHILFGQADVVGVVPAQDGDRAAVLVENVQNQLDGGALARAVLPHKAHDAAAGQGQIQRLKLKAIKMFRQIFDFQSVHCCSSRLKFTISRMSFLDRLQDAASCRICSMCSSIFFRFSSRSSSTFFGAT